MKTGIRCFDAMTKSPVVIDSEKTLKECAEIMNEEDVNSLVVKNNGEILGIVTDEDFVRKAVSLNSNMDKIKIKEIMITNVITVEPSEDIYDAIRMMGDYNIRHLPVVNKGVFVGLLTSKDVFKINPALFDLYIEKFAIREEEEKFVLLDPIDGNCDICRDFDALLEVKGQLICSRCRST